MAEKKPQKLKARLPRGLADRGPAEIAATRAMIEKIRAVYERYGFEPVETPAIEYTDALGKFLPDQDRPNEGVFSFQDDDEQWLSLRYDLTAPLARYVAENFQNLALPYRSYREGWVFRNEKPGPGRYRQFMQFDADTVGSASPAADAEMCMMAADAMEALGIKRGEYVVKVSNRKILDGVLDAIGLGGEENDKRRLMVLRALDKYDRLGVDGVVQLLGGGRKDDSGDFTPGAGLTLLQTDAILDTIRKGFEIDILTEENFASRPDIGDVFVEGTLDVSRPDSWDVLGIDPVDSASYEEGVGAIGGLISLLRHAGYQRDRIRFDATVVRGLEYYTGAVFEVELTFETKDEKGRPVRFGSVGGGGRYDGLVSRFRGEPVPATGFSIGVSRLLAALQAIKSPIVSGDTQSGPVLVTIFERERIADYQRVAQTLRNAGIRAELYLGNPKNNLGAQLKYADKRRSPCAIIQGPDERDRGEVQIKDLAIGTQLAGETKEREEYLQKQAQAQFAVKEDRLVEAVRELLAKRGIKQ
jgi:histidyl-tRNA synthetase